jgi:hypothetical protein
MNYFERIISVASIFAITSFAHGAAITTQLEDFTNGGGFFGEITFEDNGTDTVTISANIAAPVNAGLTQGDVLSLWFDFANFSALGSTATFGNQSPSAIINGHSLDEDSVLSNYGTGNTNLNGGSPAQTNWDFAVLTGANGDAQSFIQTLSFDLTIAGLDQSQFLNQRVGMRVQSIEGGDFNEGSSKLVGTGTSVTVPEPGTIALLGLGLFGLGVQRRKHQI